MYILDQYVRITTLKERKKSIVVVASIFGIVAIVALFTVFGLFTARDRQVLLSRGMMFEHDDIQRSYRQSTPKKDVQKIVIGLHGFTDTSFQFAYYTALHNAADDHTLVVYPQAVDPRKNEFTGWNAQFCCGSGWASQTDDAGFVVALSQSLAETHQVPRENVFVTGFSNGAFMAQRLAAEYPDQFGAITAVSGSIGTTTSRIEPKQPIPILLMHGEKDQDVTFNGGANADNPDFVWLPFSETKNTWQQVNKQTAPTEIITYPDDAHVWHDWRLFNIWHRTPEASQEIMTFFDKQ